MYNENWEEPEEDRREEEEEEAATISDYSSNMRPPSLDSPSFEEEADYWQDN